MDQTYMKKDSITKLVLTMAIPMALSMLVNALYNIVDSFFVAKYSEQAMTALSLIFPLQNVVNAVSIGFGVGVNAVVAYLLGAERKEEADAAASLSLLLSFLHAIILTIIMYLLLDPYLKYYTRDHSVLLYGHQYGRIVFGLLFITQIALVYEKLFQAVGKMQTSMVAMMIGCLTNIILDPLMIFGIGFPKMGIAGAAIATVIGQLLTLAYYLFMYKKHRLGLNIKLSNGFKHKYYAKQIYAVGIPAGLTQALPSLLVAALNTLLSASGVLILGIYYKLQTFIYLSAQGVVQGIRPLVAYNYGAKEYQRVNGIFKTALVLCAMIMAIGLLICLIKPVALMEMFVTTPAIIDKGSLALRIISLGFMPSVLSVCVCGVMEGLGLGIYSFLISFLRYVLIIIPVACLLSAILGITGVWHAFWIAETCTAIIALFLYHHVKNKFLS